MTMLSQIETQNDQILFNSPAYKTIFTRSAEEQLYGFRIPRTTQVGGITIPEAKGIVPQTEEIAENNYYSAEVLPATSMVANTSIPAVTGVGGTVVPAVQQSYSSGVIFNAFMSGSVLTLGLVALAVVAFLYLYKKKKIPFLQR